MKFDQITTQDLFSATKKYVVPKYQRGYAWKDKHQINDFWEDIQQIEQKNPLFLGTLILQKSQLDSNEFDIIDGQQRLTTLMLFFIVCRNYAIKNSFPQATHLPALIASHNIARGNVLLPKLIAGKNISDAFDFLVKKETYSGGPFPRHIDGRRSRILKSNYKYFEDRISQLNQESLGDLLENLLENSFFLRVVVDDAMQAFDIFERTNARGVPLNIADLLKNLLFSNETEIDKLTERWDSIVGQADVRLPRLLKYFDALTNGHDTGKAVLFAHLRSSVKEKMPAIFMNEIEIFSKFYNAATSYNLSRDASIRISSDKKFDVLYSDEIFFNRVRRSINSLNLSGVQVCIPVIYAGLFSLLRFQDDKKAILKIKSDYIKMLNTLECFHFINNGIATSPTNKTEQLYAVEAKKISSAETTTDVCASFARIIKGLQKFGIVEKKTFVENFSQIVYSPGSNKPLIAYIFDCYENNPFEKTPDKKLFDPTVEQVINRTYEVEHIASISTWTGDEDTLNSIGNLLLIPHSLNRDKGVSNLPVNEKIVRYEEKDFVSLRAVKDFCKWYKNNKLKDLNATAIDERAIFLAEYGYEHVWKPW